MAIDLVSDEWRTIPLPYLISLHASAVTFLTYVCDVSQTIWHDIVSLGKEQTQTTYSSLVSVVRDVTYVVYAYAYATSSRYTFVL